MTERLKQTIVFCSSPLGKMPRYVQYAKSPTSRPRQSRGESAHRSPGTGATDPPCNPLGSTMIVGSVAPVPGDLCALSPRTGATDPPCNPLGSTMIVGSV